MRVLIFSKTKTSEELSSDIEYLESKLYAKVDFFNDYSLAEYCMDIRNYDIVYFEYLNEYEKSYYNFLKYIKSKKILPKVFLLRDLSTKESSLLKEFLRNNDFLEVVSTNDINFKKHIQLLLDDSSNLYKISRDNIHIDLKEKKIYFEEDGKLKEIEFKKKFDFFVLLYFMRHYKSTININSLLDATCTDPEFTKDSIIESSISSIRKSFKDILDINPIKAFKKVGYRFSMNDVEEGK